MDSPQLAALREEIEELVGKMYSHSNFTHLSGLIGYKCKEHISVTTLERIWGYSTRNASKISVRTLDVIARFVDCDDWEEYCKRLHEKFQRGSEIFRAIGAINSNDLTTGTKVRIAWQPDRICVIEWRQQICCREMRELEHEARRHIHLPDNTERTRTLHGKLYTLWQRTNRRMLCSGTD